MGHDPNAITIDVLAATMVVPVAVLLEASHRAGLVGKRTDLPLSVSNVAAIQRELALTGEAGERRNSDRR